MEYYFYSKEKNLKGFINTKLYSSILKENLEQALKYRLEKYGVSEDNPVGFIYKCKAVTTVKQKENINGAYKSLPPLQITGYTSLKDIYTE